MQNYPSDEDLAYDYATTTQYLGEMCLYLDDGEAGRKYGESAASTLSRLIERHPKNARWRNMHAMAASTMAAGLSRLAEDKPALHGEAIEASRKAYELAQTNARLNPEARDEADTLAATAERLGRELVSAGEGEEALEPIRESGAVIDQMHLKDPANRRVRRLRTINRALQAEILMELNRSGEAERLLEEAMTCAEEVLLDDPADQASLRTKISLLKDEAIVLEKQGRIDEARARCLEGLEVAAVLLRKDPAMERELTNLPDLRQEARKLGIRDPLRAGTISAVR